MGADKVADDVKAQRDKVMDDFDKNLRRGKQERGGAEDEDYQFGDLTRGFFANQVDGVNTQVKNIADLGAQTRESERGAYQFVDFTRGMVVLAKGGMKDMAETFEGKGLLQGLIGAQSDKEAASTTPPPDDSHENGESGSTAAERRVRDPCPD